MVIQGPESVRGIGREKGSDPDHAGQDCRRRTHGSSSEAQGDAGMWLFSRGHEGEAQTGVQRRSRGGKRRVVPALDSCAAPARFRIRWWCLVGDRRARYRMKCMGLDVTRRRRRRRERRGMNRDSSICSHTELGYASVSATGIDVVLGCAVCAVGAHAHSDKWA